MRSDNDVHLPGLEPGYRLFDLSLSAEAAQHLDIYREARKPRHRSLIVLLGEHRCRHEDRRLLPIEHAFHHGPKRDLRLPVAHVAAQKSVHRLRVFHIPLYILYRPELIVRLLI